MYYRHIRMENEIPKYFGLIQKISYFMGYRKYLFLRYYRAIFNIFSPCNRLFYSFRNIFTQKSTILANFIIFDSKLDPRGPKENGTKNGFTLGSKRRIFIVMTMKKQFLYRVFVLFLAYFEPSQNKKFKWTILVPFRNSSSKVVHS